MHSWEAFVWGLLGGFCIQIVHLAKQQKQPKRRRAYNPYIYYPLQLVGYPFVGGIVCLAFQQTDQPLNAITALIYGANAPAILRRTTGYT